MSLIGSKTLKWLVLAGLLISYGTAKAEDENVHVGEAGYLRANDGGKVVVFTNQEGMFKAFDLQEAGAGEAALLPYVACMVPKATPRF